MTPPGDRAVTAAQIRSEAITSQKLSREAAAGIVRGRRRRGLSATVPVPLWLLLVILACGLVQLACIAVVLLAS